MQTKKIDVSREASIVGVFGAPGSGKSAWIKKVLKKNKPARMVIFDPDGEYGVFGEVTRKVSDVYRIMSANDRFCVVFKPIDNRAIAIEQFDKICEWCFNFANLTFVVDELSLVTDPRIAPENWKKISKRGRKIGVDVIGASQRPADVDKHFFSCCTLIHAGRLNFDADVSVLSNVLCVPKDKISALKPLEYIERDMATGQIKSDFLKF